MNEIDDYFKKGVLTQVFQSEYNFQIYKKVADEYEFLITQSKDVQSLYSFIQLSAITNFVLHISKLYDKGGNNTRSILSFLSLIKKHKDKYSAIVEYNLTANLLIEYGLPEEIISSVKIADPSIFPLKFSEYYLEMYHSDDIQKDIKSIKIIRDKVIAHNDVDGDGRLGNNDAVRNLLTFASQILNIYSIAYHSTSYDSLGRDADWNSYFIEAAIEELKSK